MKGIKQKGSKWKAFKKLFLYVGLPLFICFLIYAWFFTYNLSNTVRNLIKEELDKYAFGEYSIDAIAVRHDKAVLGPIHFGEDKDQLSIAKVQLNYSFGGIRNGEVESITVSGANLHLNRHGEWQLAGLEGVLRGIANYQKSNPSEGKSKIPEINVEASLITLHYQERQYSFPISMAIIEKDGKIAFEVETNLSRDRLQTFNFELDPETLTVSLKLDSFNLDITQAGHFLQRFGMRDSKGRILASDLKLSLSQERFDIEGKIQIQNFKTIYNDEGKPVTLTFDKVEPVTFSRNLKDDKEVFADTIHFHNLAYSYGTYLFSADEIKSKVEFDLSNNRYKTDSILNKVAAQLDGSRIHSQSEIELKLNWDKGELQTYSSKGKVAFSYSGGILKGVTEVNVVGKADELEVKGDFTDLIIPDGNIESGTFSYDKKGELLTLDVDVKKFSIFNDAIKGNSSFIYKKKEDLVDISGSLTDLKVFERLTGNAEVTIKENKNELISSLKNFSLKTKEGNFELAMDADLTLPVTFDQLTQKPLNSTFTASSSVSHLKISDHIFKPFAFQAEGQPGDFNFKANKLESNEQNIMKFTALSGSFDLNKKQADAFFQTQLNIDKYIPSFSGAIEPIKVALKVKENGGVLELQIDESLAQSSFEYKKENQHFKVALANKSSLEASIPLDDFLQSKLSSFKSLTQLDIKSMKTGQLAMDEASVLLKLETVKPIGFENYLGLGVQGSLRSSVDSLNFGLKKSTQEEMDELQIPQWKEELIVKDFSTELPFKWSIRKGFNETQQKIKICSISHSRQVDGGDFLGYFAKDVSVENLSLTGAVKGLQVKMKENVKLNEDISVGLQFNAGWEIPEDVLSGSKSPIPYLAEIALLPEAGFESSGSLKIPDTEITKLARFVKEPISEDNILIGKVSAEVNFLKNSQGFKLPAVVEIKKTRGYFIGENDSYIKFKGLRGKLKLKSLLDLESEDSQYLRVDFLEVPGLKLNNTLVKYKVYSPEKVRLMRLDTTWCKGKIEGADILFNPAHQSLKCTIFASKVQMEELMKILKGVECEADGSLYGRLTLEVRNGKIVNQDGFLFSEPGTKMRLQMQGNNVVYDAINDERTRKLLSNLDVEYFKILFKGGEDIDTHKTVFNLKGASAVGDPPNPLDLSINFNGPMIYYLQLPLHEQGIKNFIENKTKEKK